MWVASTLLQPFPFLTIFPVLFIVSFKIYDFDGDGFISVTDLTAVVAATLREHQIVILRSDIDQIVGNTMREANTSNPNMISLEEYFTLCANRPHMLAQLTINISNISAEYTRNNVIALSTRRGFQSALNLHNSKWSKRL